MIAEDAAIAGRGVERDNVVQQEDRKRVRGDALCGEGRQQRRGEEVVKPVDLERAGLLAASRRGAELGGGGEGHMHRLHRQRGDVQPDVIPGVDPARRGLAEELGAPEDVRVLAGSQGGSAKAVGPVDNQW